MQKSENKIKPMYFWSDGYEEYGILRPDHKKIREDELTAAVDETEENEFVFEPIKPIKKKKKISAAQEFKQWFRAHLERQRQNGRWYY